MAKVRTSFICRSCGGVQPRWMGRCPDCAAWDSLEESRQDPGSARDPQRGLAGGWDLGHTDAPKAAPIGEVGATDAPEPRLPTGVGELDRVLGGGIVQGSVILVGGDPGIGKSTLMLQAAGKMSAGGVRTLYVTSEESARQVRLRAERLGVAAARESDDQLFVLADTNLARIVEQARKVQPAVLVVDSIQMIYKADLDASPGSVAQLRRCCTDLVYLAKTSGMAVVLVGHVTKEGTLAGPRLLEHMVDAVLYFEGDGHHAHRVIRGVKNRFGATMEIGLFEMTGAGLREVPEGASVAAGAMGEAPRPGSVVCPVVTGSRCVLVEIQALTATGFPGAAKRKSSGVDSNRLAMLIAVLEQHGGLRLSDRDVFTSAVGGLRVAEPAADLPLALAIAGAHYRSALAPATAVFGEVGLGGEVRPVSQVEMRVREAARLGYRRIVLPARMSPPKLAGVETISVERIGQAMEELGAM
ncbi:MAG: DNA repair protein RadA [Phycisphaeraceae bacterium]|nr:MAG: DNA repair protein RadA [Phycisphaeraceae bacterium]